jgi:hypothetical protein
MQPNLDVNAYPRPSKIRIGLAVAWLIVSLVVGGAVGAQAARDNASTPAEVSTAGR